jgi:hypothetical protein
MSERTHLIEADHPALGKLFAAVDPTAAYIQPQVTELRFAALLAPFKTVEDAETALVAAGAELLTGGAK